MDKTHSVKSVEAGLRAYPNMAVCGLRDIEYCPAEIAVLQPPDAMTVLRDAICWVEREDPTGRGDEEDRQERKTASNSSFA